MKLFHKLFVVLILLACVYHATAQELPTRFYGTYVSNVCDECRWTLEEDGFGQWTVGFHSGKETVPVMWEPMIDSNGNLQEAVQGDNHGYALKVYYMAPLSEAVKGTMTFSTRDAGHSMVVLWYDESNIQLQFMSAINAFYEKH